MNAHTGASEIVSKAMAQCTLETDTNLAWDGFYACCEGQPLDDMPTPHHVRGWWDAANTLEDTTPVIVRVDSADEFGDAREDEEWIRRGC